MAQRKSAPGAKKTAGRSAARRGLHGGGRLLNAREVKSLIKPPENYEELAEKVVQAWRRLTVNVRVPGLSPSRLSALLRQAKRRQSVESVIRQRLELTLKRVQQARLTADDAAWRGVLKVWRFVKPHASENEQIKNAFVFLANAMSRPKSDLDKQPAPAAPQPAAEEAKPDSTN